MKKKNTFIVVTLLIAVLVLGVGYAAATQNLLINGTATGTQSDENFNVIFSAATPDSANATAEIDASDSTSRTATMTVQLSKVGDKGSATFTVKNASAAGVSAQLAAGNLTITDDKGATYSSDYFDIVTTWPSTEVTLAPNETQEFTVTVTLKKGVVGETDQVENFKINLTGFTAVAA